MAYLSNDVLSNILIRLPYKPLFRLKLVSKQWNSVISDLQFGREHMRRANSVESLHLYAFLHSHVTWEDVEHTFFPNSSDSEAPSLYVSPLSLQAMDYNVQILSSSNGLILSRIHPTLPSSSKSEVRLCVSNPLTRHFARIPSLPRPKTIWTACLSTRMNAGENSPYVTYKIVYIRKKWPPDLNKHTVIETFCSETGEWSFQELEISCPERLFYCPETQVISRMGILHFFLQETIVTYDPYNSPDRFGYIEMPGPYRVDVTSVIKFRSRTSEEDLPSYSEIEYCANGERRVSEWHLVGYDNGGEWSPVSTYFLNWWSIDGLVEFQSSSSEDDSLSLTTYSQSCPVVRIELCPWSSPLHYNTPQSNAHSLPLKFCMKIAAFY